MAEVWKSVDKNKLCAAVHSGRIIIYPTDTIYGIGCDATNSKSVKKIRSIKERTDKPFSVIAPSKQWIYSNFHVKNRAYIKKLPGPFTFLLKAKNKNILPKSVSASGVFGIRIPNNQVTKAIQKCGKPFITTSVNISGQEPAVSLDKIDDKIKQQVDIIIDKGTLDNPPSVVIDLTGEFPKIIRRG